MQRDDLPLITPIYIKKSMAMRSPTDPVYYLLTSNCLYLCRNHPYYRSCVPAPRWPTELVPHAASFAPKFPPIPQDQFERICGFFGHMSEEHRAEAIVLLAWDSIDQMVRTIVPQQVSAVSAGSRGLAYPIGVKYRFPQNLPKHWTVFSDIHSHCTMAAYASQTDIDDEDNFTGLHIVVGRLHQEPPEFHVEGVVDGTRFPLQWESVVSGYECRDAFPKEWMDQIVVTNYATFCDFDFDGEDFDEARRRASERESPAESSEHD